MRMRALVSVMFLLAALAWTSSAGAQATTRTWSETGYLGEPYIVVMDCIPEPLLWTGSVTTVYHETETPSGVSYSAGHTTVDLTVTGTVTGDSYRVIDIRQIYGVAPTGPRDSFTYAFLVIGPGSGDNFQLLAQIRLVVTPSGEVTVDFSRLRTECVG
jgi:hypothetical protein